MRFARTATLLVLSLLALAIASLACNGDGGSEGEPGTLSPTASEGTDIDELLEELAGTPNPISTSVVVGRFPDGFPSDFPVFPDAEVLRAAAIEDRFLAGLTTTASREDVIAFYEEELAQSRWQIVDRDVETLVDTTFLIITDADGGRGSVAIATLEGATNIVLSVPK